MAIYKLTQKELREVQLIQLEMLKEVDRICRKCNIRYNIIAGTLLGAVRHKGFMPWDDDADVALLRPEYEKFCKVCEKELDKEKFYFQDHHNTPGYRWGYGKLRRRNTLFIRENQEHMPYEQGVFIDIFPLDNVPDNKLHRVWYNFHCFCIRKCMWAPVGKVSAKGIFAKLAYTCMDKFSHEQIYRHYDKFIQKTKKIKSKWVRILTYPTPNREYGYRRRWYEKSVKLQFEGVWFDGIKDWDSYLKFKFGNYMELPKESERKKHNVTKLKINV